MSYLAKLHELGYDLQPINMDTGRFMHAVRTGNLIYTSGQVPRWGDQEIKGKIGQELSVEEGYQAARLCAVNCLQAVHTLTGSIDNVVRIVKVLGMVNSAPGFNRQPEVINGFSEVILDLFGPGIGRHARSAVGMAALPFDIAVEIEAEVEIAS